MNRFPGVDYMDFDSLLTEEQRLVRDTVRAWVDEKVLPIIEEATATARFPMELVPEMAAMSLFGATLAEYGLPGLDNVAYGLIMQELERGDSGPALLRLGAVARSSCTRSTPSARRSRRTAGSRSWPPARRSAASA